MAYSNSAMRLISGGYPTQQLFMYTTTDVETVIDDSGYFDNAVTYQNLDTGDVILAVYDTGGTIGLRAYVVTNTSGTVTVTDQDGI